MCISLAPTITKKHFKAKKKKTRRKKEEKINGLKNTRAQKQIRIQIAYKR